MTRVGLDHPTDINIIKAVEDAVDILWMARRACFPNQMAGHEFICHAQEHLANGLRWMLYEPTV